MGMQTQVAGHAQLDEAIGHLRNLQGSEPWLKQVDELHHRLNRQEKLVAVFGAFSAGKSSLMNAMLGDNLLVVSPNPTTASVTHVQAPRPGTNLSAYVTAKTEAQLWEDVQLALNHIHKPAASLTEAIAFSPTLKISDFVPAVRRYVAFLQAVSSGFLEMAGKLGTQWMISESDLLKFTADERFACFIHRVELGHAAPALEKGMVLVDTPGVDSIHRRHTDVAFQYMQSADAILFVLYYTHAFSRADRDFLSQLADVQDVVGTNKLFVVINAVDLAANEEERVAVRKRVDKELRQLGIRQPRVYEVSSQLSFTASQLAKNPADIRFEGFIRQHLNLLNQQPLPAMQTLQEASGVPTLMADLSAYVEDQADQLATSAVRRRLQSVATEVVTMYERKLEEMTADESSRAQWQRDQQHFADQFEDQTSPVMAAVDHQHRLLQAQWAELVYHMGERIRLRYASLFREAFHPGRFRGGNERVQMQEAARELVDVLARLVDAECRTFALRAHRQMVRAMEQWLAFIQNQLHAAHADDVRGSSLAVEELGVSTLPRHAKIGADLLRPYFRYFSSAKQFFEGGGQQEMLSESESVVLTAIRAEVEEISSEIRKTTWQTARAQVALITEAVQTRVAVGLTTEWQVDTGTLGGWATAAQWFRRWLIASSTADEPVI